MLSRRGRRSPRTLAAPSWKREADRSGQTGDFCAQKGSCVSRAFSLQMNDIDGARKGTGQRRDPAASFSPPAPLESQRPSEGTRRKEVLARARAHIASRSIPATSSVERRSVYWALLLKRIRLSPPMLPSTSSPAPSARRGYPRSWARAHGSQRPHDGSPTRTTPRAHPRENRQSRPLRYLILDEVTCLSNPVA